MGNARELHSGLLHSTKWQSSRPYHGRVRTGCLTCRTRKVKCDESRPTCSNCTKLDRKCTYPVPRKPGASAHARQSEILSPGKSHPAKLTLAALLSDEQTQEDAHVLISNYNSTTQETAPQDSSWSLISRDIELTTTMDFLTARGKSLHIDPCVFFLDHVDCPPITPFDSANWDVMKLHFVERARSCSVISAAIAALSSVYRAQMYAMCASNTSLPIYHSAKEAFRHLVRDKDGDTGSEAMGNILMTSFLLCVFEYIYPDELQPTLKKPDHAHAVLLRFFRNGASYLSSSQTSSRLVAWLRIIHRITLRGGGTGLISDQIIIALSEDSRSSPSSLPHLSPPVSHSDPTGNHTCDHLYQALSEPMFEFYYHLQLVSGDIARLTHYHRSRTTGHDQEHVALAIKEIKSRLHSLWDSRCTTHRHSTRASLASQLGPELARRLASLIGLCDAAYHAEIVELDRVRGDPVTRWTSDSRVSMQAIKDIVDAETVVDQSLSPGFLRPLFMYAIECMDRGQNKWAVGKMKQIQNPVCRSDFFAAFGLALSNAQLSKDRRVTSKYFCTWYFGVTPPFM